jgi:hypothetical protein
MDRNTLIAAIDFGRDRLLGTLDAIEKSGQDVQKVLAWRPGPGRAHIAWQAMHCAATHDKYVNVYLRGGKVKDESLVATYGGGSTPADQNVPTLQTVRQTLETHLLGFKEFVQSVAPGDFSKKIMAGSKERTIGESIVLLTWHEAHHQGQIHLTWNLYKAAHGVK